MLSLNRTEEFQKLFDRKRQSSIQYRSNEELRSNQNLTHSQFHMSAKNVALDLQHTVDMLEQLTRLVKNQTPFDDQNSPRIRNLTVQLKDRLGTHKVVLEDLQEQLLQQQQRKNQESKHSETIVSALKSKLSYSFQQFQTVLKNRTKQMKSIEERQKKFGISNSSLQQSPSIISPNAPHGGLVPAVQSPSVSNKPLGGNMQMQETMLNVLQSNENYILQRNQDIQEIESEIVQLGGMFNQLAIMIKEQGELTQTIERNVSSASHYVDQAQSELLRYLRRLTSNRGLIIKIFVVMIVFIGLIGAFVLS